MRPAALPAHLTRAIAALLALACAAAPALAQKNPCTTRHPMVDAVSFTGNKTLTSNDIAALVETERTGLFRRAFGWNIGALTCLDSAMVVSDAAMVQAVYRDRGYLTAKVTPTITRRGDRRAKVTFTIREGLPVVITSVVVSGLPSIAADSAAVVRRLMGEPLDDSVVTAVGDSIQSLMRDAGYARAGRQVVRVSADSAFRAGTVTMEFHPGLLTWIGKVDVKITPSGSKVAMSERAARAAFGVQEGDQYSARKIGEGQRALLAFDMYRQVRVDTVHLARDSAAVARDSTAAVRDTAVARDTAARRDTTVARDSTAERLAAARFAAAARDTAEKRDTIGLALTLVEGDRKRARATAGWGTLDCFRTQARFVEQNFLGLGHRFELNSRLSKIGLAAPFTGLSGLCSPSVREDPFSQHLNYYAGATVRLRGIRGFGGARWQPQVTIFSERRSSVGAYEQTTEVGALLTSTHLVAPRLSTTLQYAYTDTRTLADRAVSCERFGFCRLEDVASFVLRSPQHSISGSLVKNQLLLTDDPRSTYRWQLDAKYGIADIGRILKINFSRGTGEVAVYRQIGPSLVLAMRAQGGAVLAPDDRSFLLPPAERFYSGGQNSVRGFGQNLLGPGSYIVNNVDTVAAANGTQYGIARPNEDAARVAPSGGNRMWVANVELRTTRGFPNDLLRWVLFVDAGRVWNTRDVFSVTNASARVTPGFGVRLLTPLGPFRIDVGYDPSNFEPGPAFLIVRGDLPNGIAGRAICVSPGTDDPLVLMPGQSSTSNPCPATFVPPIRGSLMKRLTFHFSLGNAF